VISDTKAALANDEVVKVLRLSRSNYRRLKQELKAGAATRRVQIAGGISIEMPSTDVDHKVVATLKDGPLRSGRSAFYRLFSIMAGCTEEEFPRAKMTEFLGVWAEIWDSPLGTATAKLNGFLAFYEKYAQSLGKGEWLKNLDGDSRFFHENMLGDNPDACHKCRGTGEHDGSAAPARSRASPDKKRARDTGSQSKPAFFANQICASMLIQGRSCPANCSRKHSPCPSCGGACTSATACAAWDSVAVRTKHKDALDRLAAATSRHAKRKP
jgi:hypothetical protein